MLNIFDETSLASWICIKNWTKIRTGETDIENDNAIMTISLYVVVYDGVRQVSGLRREPVVSVKNTHWKDDPDPVMADSDPLVASFVHRTPAQIFWYFDIILFF